MEISLEKYGSASYPFPKDEIDPKLKDREWARKWCEAMYARWKQGLTAIPHSSLKEFQTLRELADGKQNIHQYQKILMDESEDSTDITGYMNINWDVFSVMPKFLRVVEGMMEQTDHQVVATAVDPSSTEEKEDMKLDMEYRMKFREAVNYINKGLGIDNSDQYIPESIEELNLYEGAGGFKLAKETEIEQGLDYTFYISDWRETKKKLIRDLAVINCAATKDYTDPYTAKAKTRYVDPAVYVGQYSKHWDHKNMEYGGEIIQVLISDLRKLNIEGIDENILRQLAEKYNGYGSNIRLESLSFDEDLNTATYDCFLVDVLDCEWFSVDSTYKTTKKVHGNEMLYDEKWGKVYDDEKRKTNKYDIKVIYKCKWIIETDCVYDFGLQHDIPRPGKKEVELSYHLYKLPYRSLVSLSTSHLHQMALAFYRLQNAIAMAAPPGIAVEYTALQNMTLSKNKLKPIELLRIRKQQGDLIYKATTHQGVQNIPGGIRPIQELSGGIGAQLNEFLAVFEFNTEAIRELTGINQIADASTPEKDVSVQGSQMALVATNNALRPIYSAYINLKEKTAKNVSLRLQLLIKHNKEAYKGYMPVIGRLGVQIISVGADVVDADYHIKYEARPTDKDRETIMQAATAAMSPDRDGVIGIELSDWLMINRISRTGNLKYAEALLNYRSKKNKERQQQLQRENMQLDKQREQEAIKLKSESDRLAEKTKTDEAIRLYEAKKEVDEKYLRLEHERKKELVQLESTLGIVKDVAKSNAEVPVS